MTNDDLCVFKFESLQYYIAVAGQIFGKYLLHHHIRCC